jgi:hypothetical protein
LVIDESSSSDPATETISDEKRAEAKAHLIELAKALGRASATACHKLGIRFDMDDPQVARDVMLATFDGLFLSKPRARCRGSKGGTGPPQKGRAPAKA